MLSDASYTARLIEGYDLNTLRNVYVSTLPDGPRMDKPIEGFLKQRLSFSADGAVSMEESGMGQSAVSEHVTETVMETIERFDLIPPGSSIVLGLSGGVDSGSLTMLLSKYRERSSRTDFSIMAATFQDFDSKHSAAFDYAAEIANKCGVEHGFIEAGLAEEVFNLKRPLAQVLMLLMETEDAHQAMYVDHHTTRRMIEVYADEQKASQVAIGLHATDLLAGLLNSMSTGHELGGIPGRTVGNYRYIFPLAFAQKRELHLFYAEELGHLPKQTTPNQWEFNPTDRNFYYYLADHLQWIWPGVQNWMLTSQGLDDPGSEDFHQCENCSASVRDLRGAPEWIGICDVCSLLEKHGWIGG